jgi:hypothetical protein
LCVIVSVVELQLTECVLGLAGRLHVNVHRLVTVW